MVYRLWDIIRIRSKNIVLNYRNIILSKKSGGETRVGSAGNIAVLFLLFAISFLLYANSLRNGYARDDVEVIYQNSYVLKGIHGIPEILSTPHLHGYIKLPNETYRPLSLVFFAIEYELFGANPAVGHFSNIVIFGLCVILLFLFLNRLFDRKKTIVSFIAALIFATHPIHTEVVANIKSFDSLLCFFFAFLSLNIFLSYYEDGRIAKLFSGLLILFLSFISKETVISFIVIVPLLFFCYKNTSKRRSFYISAGTIIVAAAFIALRTLILRMNDSGATELNIIDNALVGAPDSASKIATAFVVLGYYLKLMLIPYPLICDYSLNSIPYAHFTDSGAQLSLVVYSFLITTAVYRLIKFKRDPWAFGILFFLIAIALFSNIFFLIPSQMSERFTFFPSVGYSLVAALTFEKFAMRSYSFSLKTLFTNRKFLLLIPVLSMFSFITVDRNSEWTDNYTLFKNDLEKSPQNSHLNYCMGDVLLDSLYQTERNPQAKQEILKESIRYLGKSVEIDPSYLAAQMSVAYAFYLNGQLDSAEIHNKAALHLSPDNVTIINNLSVVYFQDKKYADAMAMSLKSIALDPGFVQGYNSVGLCYNNLNKPDSGIIYISKAISADPRYGDSYKNMAIIYRAKGEVDSAKKYETIYQTINGIVIDL